MKLRLQNNVEVDVYAGAVEIPQQNLEKENSNPNHARRRFPATPGSPNDVAPANLSREPSPPHTSCSARIPGAAGPSSAPMRVAHCSTSAAPLLELWNAAAAATTSAAAEIAALEHEDHAAHSSSREVSTVSLSTESEYEPPSDFSAEASQSDTSATVSDIRVRNRRSPKSRAPGLRTKQLSDSKATECAGGSSDSTMENDAQIAWVSNCYTCHLRGGPVTRGRGRGGPASRRPRRGTSSGVLLIRRSTTCTACGQDAFHKEGIESVRVGGQQWRAAMDSTEGWPDPQFQGIGGQFQSERSEGGVEARLGSGRMRKCGRLLR